MTHIAFSSPFGGAGGAMSALGLTTDRFRPAPSPIGVGHSSAITGTPSRRLQLM